MIERMKVYTHYLRTKVTEGELNVVSNLAARDGCSASQLVRKLIREAASKVPLRDRKDLSLPPTVGMRARLLGIPGAFGEPKAVKKRVLKRSKKRGRK